MSHPFDGLRPEKLWTNFARLCSIPHPSCAEGAASAWIKAFARGNGLDFQSDAAGNIVIRKPATPGRESARTLILQAHIDMVPQKESGLEFDFLKDPIRPVVDGGWVKASGTTLGADNGIGLAAVLAVLESKEIPSGPLEALFTVEEEIGLKGARRLDASMLSGVAMVNTDSATFGEVTVGCSGGVDTDVRIPLTFEDLSSGLTGVEVVVGDLAGGHSGTDIHRGRGNSNRLMARLLLQTARMFEIRLGVFEGGGPRNAIPRETRGVVSIPKHQAEAFEAALMKAAEPVWRELHDTDSKLSVRISPARNPRRILGMETTKSFLRALHSCPNGVLGLSAQDMCLVETSSNLAYVRIEDGFATIRSHQRSLVDSLRDDAADMFAGAFEGIGGAAERHDAYCGWKPDLNSKLLHLAMDVHRVLCGAPPRVKVMHAGLECGVVGGLRPGMEMVAVGPTICRAHSPEERVDIDSVERFWSLLVGIVSRF